MSRANYERTIKNKGFDKNPQNINRKGTPKKILKTLMESLREKYGVPVSKAESLELLTYVESLPFKKLAEFIKDEELPAAVQAYARLLLTGEQKDIRRVSAIELVKDRLHGRPKQATESEIKLDIPMLNVTEDVKKIIDSL